MAYHLWRMVYGLWRLAYYVWPMTFTISYTPFAISYPPEVGILHAPVTVAEQAMPIVIVAQSANPENVARATLFFRALGDVNYQTRLMSRERELFTAQIPAEMTLNEVVEYYLQFRLRDGRTLSHPEQDSEMLPHVVFVQPQPSAVWLDILYPESNASISEKRPEIAAAFAPGMIQADTVIVLLDGREVTPQCELTDQFLLYLPEKDLAVGAHWLTVRVESPSFEDQTFWHFRVTGEPPLLTRPHGFASATWQWNHTTNDSPFLLYDLGGNVNATVQLNTEFRGRPLNVWFNRSALYQTKDTEISLSLTGEHGEVDAGNIFPQFSSLTLDSVPASGTQVKLSLGRSVLSLVAARTDFLIGDDPLLSALLTSQFAGARAELKLPYGIVPSLVLLYATDSGEDSSEAELTVQKRDWLYSGGLEVDLPRRFRLSTEWARNDKHSTYASSELVFEAAENQLGDAFLVRFGRSTRPLSLEIVYQDIGAAFAPEVNPFWENGKRGIAISTQYHWSNGISAQAEYGRYAQRDATTDESDFSMVEGSASIHFSPREIGASLPLPTLSLLFNRQRVPYAQYSLRSTSVHTTYTIARLQLAASYSLAQADFWTSDDTRESISTTATLSYQLRSVSGSRAAPTLTASLGYSGYSSHLQNGDSQKRRQIWFGFDYRFGGHHHTQSRFDHLEVTDTHNSENDALQRGGQLQYEVTF